MSIQCNLNIIRGFYGPLCHPYNCLPMDFVPLAQVCVVYVVKEVTSFLGLSQLMGMVHKRTRAQATDQQEQCKC